MALYLGVGRFRRAGLDASAVRKEANAVNTYFSTWAPPEGVALVHLWGAVDGSGSYSVWEADGHAALTTLVAQFLPWMDFEMIPIAEPAEFIAAQTVGGLYNAD